MPAQHTPPNRLQVGGLAARHSSRFIRCLRRRDVAPVRTPDSRRRHRRRSAARPRHAGLRRCRTSSYQCRRTGRGHVRSRMRHGSPAVSGRADDLQSAEMILGGKPDTTPHPRGLLALTKSLGWGMLAEVPGREVIMGAVTQPWEANVVFRPLAAWRLQDLQRARLREDRLDAPRRHDRPLPSRSSAARRGRSLLTKSAHEVPPVWLFLSPGIIIIRWMMLQPLKTEAESRALKPTLSRNREV